MIAPGLTGNKIHFWRRTLNGNLNFCCSCHIVWWSQYAPLIKIMMLLLKCFKGFRAVDDFKSFAQNSPLEKLDGHPRFSWNTCCQNASFDIGHKNLSKRKLHKQKSHWVESMSRIIFLPFYGKYRKKDALLGYTFPLTPSSSQMHFISVFSGWSIQTWHFSIFLSPNKLIRFQWTEYQAFFWK